MFNYREIKISDINANQYQPRTEFDDELIQELAASIKENGLIQPITVRDTKNGYQIVAGERRYRACKSLGMDKITAIVIKADDLQSAQMALIENVQRENLSAIDEANAYQQILRLSGMNQVELAKQVGKSQSAVANKLRLLNLNEEVQKAIAEKTITERHGRALLSLDNENQSKALKQIVAKNMNVEQTEHFVESISTKKKKSSTSCFGASIRILVNTVRSCFNELKKVSPNVSLNEEEKDDSIVMTIVIKK